MPWRIILLMGVVCLAPTVVAQDSSAGKATAATAAAITALKRGGYVLYMRHAASDTSKPDRVPEVDFNDCGTQRPLSAEGRRDAADIGKAIRSLGIPIGEVLVSPYCRAKETAELAFGRAYVVERSLMTTSNLPEAEKAPLLAVLRGWLARPVADGTNRVLLSHNAPLMDAVGIFPKPEGAILVFRPDGKGGFAHLATIAPADWARIVTHFRQ